MHNDARHFQEQAVSVEKEADPKGSADAARLLRFFSSRMDLDRATDGELEWLAYANENTQLMVSNLSKTLEGIAALISYEDDREGVKSGALQSHNDLPNLLFGAADTLATVEEMTFIASEAGFKLRERYRKRAERNV